MYVVYDQPLAMLCDSPTSYEKEPEFTKFLAEIPTVWSEKDAGEGAIGEYIMVTAYTEDGSIYIAGLNGETPRSVMARWYFTDYDAESVEIWMDSEDDSADYQHLKLTWEEYQTLAINNPIEIKTASGGGFVLKITGKPAPHWRKKSDK
jgi:alpha-glucosidase